jgi:hypothetical protein
MLEMRTYSESLAVEQEGVKGNGVTGRQSRQTDPGQRKAVEYLRNRCLVGIRYSMLSPHGPVAASPRRPVGLQAAEGLIERTKTRRDAFRQAGLPGFTNVNLVERLQAQVCSLILFHQDGAEVDVKHFRLVVFRNVRTDEVDIIGSGAARDAASALKQVQHSFRTLIRYSPLHADALADEVDLLAVKGGNTDVNQVSAQMRFESHQATDLGYGPPFNAKAAGTPKVNSAVGSDRVRSGQIGPTGDADLEDIWAMHYVAFSDALIAGACATFRQQDVIQMRLAKRAAGQQKEAEARPATCQQPPPRPRR